MEHTFTSDQLLFALSAALAGLCYVLYWIFGHSPRFIGLFGDSTPGTVQEVTTRRIFGLLVMGVFPFLAITALSSAELEDLGLVLQADNRFYYWLLAFAVVSLGVNYAAGHNAHNNSVYPQIRKSEWTAGTFFIEFLTWALYLLGYEFIFRGLLLFGALHIMSVPSAIVLNVLIYSFAHLPKGHMETVGSVIMGSALCLAAVQTNSLWIAFFGHVMMAWTNSVMSFYFNPEFSYAARRE